MLILLPPSETKRGGGADGTALDLSRLSFPELTKPRRTVLAATRSLARNASAMATALRLGPTQHFELIRNRELGRSPLLPALERYTGVLYDALDAPSLSDAARAFAESHVVIHSALFGLLGASDPIPAYRLSHDSRLPGLPLKRVWREPISSLLGDRHELILDLRSEAYAELGPAGGGANAFYLRVVSVGPNGQRRALNHFNKKGKGEFVRALLGSGEAHRTVDSLLGWAEAAGLSLAIGTERELTLVV
ncbi:MAG: YaaA family protein [Lacisediminihabitans sp.]